MTSRDEIILEALTAIAGVKASQDDIARRPIHWAQGFDDAKTACFAAIQDLVKESPCQS